MRLLICSGGTGGHLYPAIATLEVLRRRDDLEVLFILPYNSNIKKKIEDNSTKIEFIRLSKPRLSFIWLKEFYFSFKYIKDKIKSFFPQVILGMGSYASLVPILAASGLPSPEFVNKKIIKNKIPLILHEQNVILGRANKLLTLFADKVCLSFPTKRRTLRNKMILTGCPVRRIIGKIKQEEGINYFNLDKRRKTLFVFGGSLGASQINSLILQLVKEMRNKNYQLIWVTGKKDYESLKKEVYNLDFPIYIIDYLEDIAYAYAAADLIISRAGGSTLAELSVVGKPTILIPYPYAKDRHQEINAKMFLKYQKNTLIYRVSSKSSLNDLTYAIDYLINEERQERGILHQINVHAAASLAEIIEECCSSK
jgi:UDP-N-acetylglucosamine--N-acetylmuramyl-(pentapeptide) pyrophosphoryl-undecaprenol N-acetylglucosamine transferase